MNLQGWEFNDKTVFIACIEQIYKLTWIKMYLIKFIEILLKLF